MRRYCLRTLWLKDQGKPFSKEAAMGKLMASEVAEKVCFNAIQIHGSYGYSQEFFMSWYSADQYEQRATLNRAFGPYRAAFWAMLTLSAVIASAGVLADSTATVIGAMIIAPLSTPIMGIALGIAKQEPGGAARAGRFVLGGATLVVAIGVLFALVIPDTFDLLGNSQISGRTSPGLGDLVAAVATGFAGAIALARRDVAAVLPGVAIAISLVPPLAVVGVCLGQGAFGLAIGALVLFLSNLIALVLAGTLVFAALGAKDPARPMGPAAGLPHHHHPVHRRRHPAAVEHDRQLDRERPDQSGAGCG